MTNLSPTQLYWLGWATLTTVALTFAWFAGPYIIARGLEIWISRSK
jgi:hypothetical protein